MEKQYVPFSYCHQWISTSLKMAEKHFWLFVGLGAFCVVTGFCVQMVPYVGSIATPPLYFLYSLGSLRFVRHLQQSKTGGKFDEFINFVFDGNTLNGFRNYLGASMAIGLFFMLMGILKVPHHYLLWGLCTASVNVLAISAFLTLQKPEMSQREAFDFVMDKIFANFLTFFALFILLGIFSFFALLFLLVPYFLYYLPMTFPLLFVIYCTVCEGKSLEEVQKDWGYTEQIG